MAETSTTGSTPADLSAHEKRLLAAVIATTKEDDAGTTMDAIKKYCGTERIIQKSFSGLITHGLVEITTENTYILTRQGQTILREMLGDQLLQGYNNEEIPGILRKNRTDFGSPEKVEARSKLEAALGKMWFASPKDGYAQRNTVPRLLDFMAAIPAAEEGVALLRKPQASPTSGESHGQGTGGMEGMWQKFLERQDQKEAELASFGWGIRAGIKPKDLAPQSHDEAPKTKGWQFP